MSVKGFAFEVGFWPAAGVSGHCWYHFGSRWRFILVPFWTISGPWSPKWFQYRSTSFPNGSQIVSWAQNRARREPKGGQGSPKGAQGSPKRAQTESKGAPKEPKGSPKGGQGSPKRAKREPKRAKTRPKGPQREPKGAQNDPKMRPKTFYFEFVCFLRILRFTAVNQMLSLIHI